MLIFYAATIPQQAFNQAVLSGDLRKIQNVTQNVVTKAIPDVSIALFYALANDRMDIWQAASQGAMAKSFLRSINKKNPNGQTLLMVAIIKGRYDIAKSMLEHHKVLRLNIRAIDKFNKDVANYAIEKDNKDLLALIGSALNAMSEEERKGAPTSSVEEVPLGEIEGLPSFSAGELPSKKPSLTERATVLPEESIADIESSKPDEKEWTEGGLKIYLKGLE